MFLPEQLVSEPPVSATDGTLWRTPASALLHDMLVRQRQQLELRWTQLLPVLQDAATISATRCELRLSQAELAKAAGISESLLARIERGERRVTEPAVNAIWGAMWHEYEARRKTPEGIEVLVRLDQELDAMIVSERVPL